MSSCSNLALQRMDDKKPSNYSGTEGLHANMKVKVIGERVVVHLDMSRENMFALKSHQQ
jgi:hypothetical protein